MFIFADIDGTHFNNEHRFAAIPSDKTRTENWHEFNALRIVELQDALELADEAVRAKAVDIIYLDGDPK